MNWTHHFLLSWNSSYTNLSLFASLFLLWDWHPVVTRNYTSFSLDPTLTKTWDDQEEMIPTPQRTSDDANPQTTNKTAKFWSQHIIIAVNSVHRLFDYMTLTNCLIFTVHFCLMSKVKVKVNMDINLRDSQLISYY